MIDLKSEFERVWPWLEPAVERTGGAHTKATVWDTIRRGDAQLWPLRRSAIVTEILTRPSGQKIILGWLAGGSLQEIADAVPKLEAFGAAQGCSAAKIVGRRGWVKALDYQYEATIMTKDLTLG
ncbi:MAG: hypothetical protein JJ902_04065 [Roseibium sp.]|nr:hypothetical protein [Roseibium sp.]